MAHTAGICLCDCSIGLLGPNVWRCFSFVQTFDVTWVEIVVEALVDAFAHIDAVMA